MEKERSAIKSAAVVLGMGPTSLALVRALGRKGVKIYGVGLNRHEVSLSSKYCRGIGAIDPRFNPEGLLELLLNFGRSRSQKEKLILYPTGDECVVFIAEYYKQLSNHYHFSKLNTEIIELFLNKAKFYTTCLKYQLPAPKTFLPGKTSDVEIFSQEISFPCILKPKYYHVWAIKHGLAKVVFCRDYDAFINNCKEYQDFLDDFIIQEVLDGPEDDIYVVAAYMDKNGNPHGVFSGRKIRQYPVGFGTTTMIQGVDIPELKTQAVNFLQKVGYQGLVDFEFKYDRKDKSFKVIEINPRMGRWYGIVEASGYDTMYYSYLDLIDKKIPAHKVSFQPVKWIFTLRDIPSVIKNPNCSIGKAIRSYNGSRTWCIWAKDDPKPFFAYFFEVIVKGVSFIYKTMVKK